MRVVPEYLRGAEYYAARRAILRDGLHAQLFVKCYDQALLVVEVQPRPGFVHLTRNWQECISAYGPYHISVGFSPGVGLTDASLLAGLVDGLVTNIPIREVQSRGSLVIGDGWLRDAIAPLHARVAGGYADREIHISAQLLP